MANNNGDDKPTEPIKVPYSTIERGSYGDRGVLESGRPDGVGSPSDDQPILPSRQAVRTPDDITKRK
jgi:hypothetical protein